MVRLYLEDVIEIDNNPYDGEVQKKYTGRFVYHKSSGLCYIDRSGITYLIVCGPFQCSDGEIVPYDLIMEAFKRKYEKQRLREAETPETSVPPKPENHQTKNDQIDIDTLIKLKQSFDIEEIIKLKRNGII